ncbi:MAG: L-threonine 3-dehydrogenase [Acholeplasmataceae bacterium]
MKMTAVIKDKRDKGCQIIETDVPTEVGPKDVLIKILATSICGTDVHIYKWDKWSQKRVNPPHIMGHEFSGRVIKVGSEVTRVKVDDLVTAETHLVCETCEFCLRGEYHICENTKIIGVDIDGCFTEYIVMPEFNIIVNQKDGDPRYLSIQEPLGNAVHTMLHFDIVDKNVAVVGCGPIGLMGVNIAKAVGSRKIIAIEVNPYRIELAKKLGADVVINPKEEDVIARVLEETNGKGVDVVTEFSGNKSAMEAAFKYVKPGGKMSMLGLTEEDITFDISNDFVFKGVTMYGVVGRLLFETWDQVKTLIESDRLDLKQIVTHILPLDEVEKGMEIMMSGNCGKVVLIPNP